MTSNVKYSDDELGELYEIAREQGWSALDQSERISLGRYCTRKGLERPGLAPRPKPKPQTAAPAAPSAPVEGGEAYFRALGMPVKDERTKDDLRLMKSVKILDRLPDDVIVTSGRLSQYADVVEAMKRFGKPVEVRSAMTRKRAMSLRSEINRARTSTWRPDGAFQAFVAPDHEHEGLFRVIAQYQGGEDVR